MPFDTRVFQEYSKRKQFDSDILEAVKIFTVLDARRKIKRGEVHRVVAILSGYSLNNTVRLLVNKNMGLYGYRPTQIKGRNYFTKIKDDQKWAESLQSPIK